MIDTQKALERLREADDLWHHNDRLSAYSIAHNTATTLAIEAKRLRDGLEAILKDQGKTWADVSLLMEEDE